MNRAWPVQLMVALGVVVGACTPVAEPAPVATRADALLTVTLNSPFDFARLRQPPMFSATVAPSNTGTFLVTFQFSAAPDFTTLLDSATTTLTTSTTWDFGPTLPPGTTYWRVIATQAPEAPVVSAVRSVTIDPAIAAGPDWYATTEPQLRSSSLVVLDQTSTSRAGDGEVIVGFSSTPVFFDDFESATLSAWTVANAAPPTLDITNAASTGAPSGSRVMKVVDLDAAGTSANAMHDWGTALGRGAIDFQARVEAAGPRFEGGFLRAGVTNYATSVVWGDLLSVLYIDNFSVITDLTPPVTVAANTWHRYRIEYDDRGSYDLFMDGARIGTNLPMQSRGDITRVNAHTSTYYTALVQDFELDDVGVYPGVVSGAWTSPPISVVDLGGDWRSVSWTGVVGSGQRLAVQVLRIAQPSMWVPVEDSVLPGNSVGLTVSPVSLLPLDPAQHPALRIKVLLSRAAVTDGSPRLDSLTVTGTSGPPVDGGLPDGGGSADAGGPDAGSTDAGGPDAGSTDAGSTDAGDPDAGDPDADAGSSGDSGVDGGPGADAGALGGGSSDGGDPTPRTLHLGCSSTSAAWPLAAAALALRRRRRAVTPARSALPTGA